MTDGHRVQVRVGEAWDHLVASGSHPSLSAVVAGLLPGLAIHRRVGGVVIPGSRAGELLDADPAAVDLRWSPDAKRFAENRRRAYGGAAAHREAIRAVLAAGPDHARTLLRDARDTTPLDDHQLVNVAAMTLPGIVGLCVFDEQGAGKTVTGIFTFDVLAGRDEVDFVLIVAPKSMVGEWPAEFDRFTGDLYRVATLTGPDRQKRAALASGADVVVTNFEAVVSMAADLSAHARRYDRRSILLVDESFFIKNPQAQRTRALRRLREWFGRAYVLCGTPAPNAAADLVEQFNLVDFGVTFDGTEVPHDREEARAVVQGVLDARGAYARHLKADVLPELPVKRFNRLLISMQPQQRKLYAAALHDLLIDLRAVDEAEYGQRITSFLARRSALLQICSNPTPLTPGYAETPAKLLVLDGLLRDLAARGEKTVVWSFYTASLTAIMDRYRDLNPVRYDGTVTDIGARRRSVHRFQEDDETMLFVANPAAAGAGLTLHRARYAVYESLSNQAAHYLQSLDRIHRRGQARDVEYVVLLCDGSLEVEEYDRLTRKGQAAQQLLGDATAPPRTRDHLLGELERAAALLFGSGDAPGTAPL